MTQTPSNGDKKIQSEENKDYYISSAGHSRSPTGTKTTYGRLDIVKRQVVTGPNLNIWASTNIIIYTSYFPGTR
jgi:hypothetical protein